MDSFPGAVGSLKSSYIDFSVVDPHLAGAWKEAKELGLPKIPS